MDKKLFNEIKASLEDAGQYPGFYNITYQEPVVSDIELRIRKETMDAIDALVIEIFKESSSKRMEELSELIQDRLTLLWGPCNE